MGGRVRGDHHRPWMPAWARGPPPTPGHGPLTGGAGVDHPGQGQLVLQVQHGPAHLGAAGVLGFVALVKHDLGWPCVKDCLERSCPSPPFPGCEGFGEAPGGRV